VALTGRLVGGLDSELNRAALDVSQRRLRGIAVAAGLAIGAGAIGFGLHRLLEAIPFGMAIEALIITVFLAQKSLIDHVEAVGRALLSGGVAEGRRAVALIVGRDVSGLDEAGITRAAMESAAENFSDGVVAPVFWYALLGLPGLLIYKTANTADSMIGHRGEQYEAFGWATARFDDALNIMPARLSALLLAAAAAIAGCDGRHALRAAWRDARQHKSPNAGWPEAALAGALGVAFGGPRRYGAVEVDGAWLNGEGRRDVGPADLLTALRLVDTAWSLILILLAGGALATLATAL
jgi:adenosylcobinamide-phosphate synthase